MQFKLSKKQWEFIGKQAGWINKKIAMPVKYDPNDLVQDVDPQTVYDEVNNYLAALNSVNALYTKKRTLNPAKIHTEDQINTQDPLNQQIIRLLTSMEGIKEEGTAMAAMTDPNWQNLSREILKLSKYATQMKGIMDGSISIKSNVNAFFYFISDSSKLARNCLNLITDISSKKNQAK